MCLLHFKLVCLVSTFRHTGSCSLLMTCIISVNLPLCKFFLVSFISSQTIIAVFSSCCLLLWFFFYSVLDFLLCELVVKLMELQLLFILLCLMLIGQALRIHKMSCSNWQLYVISVHTLIEAQWLQLVSFLTLSEVCNLWLQGHMWLWSLSMSL